MAARVKKGVGEARGDSGDERKEERERGKNSQEQENGVEGTGAEEGGGRHAFPPFIHTSGERWRRWRRRLSRRYFGFPHSRGLCPLLPILLLFAPPLVCLPTTPDETARRALAVVLSDRA